MQGWVGGKQKQETVSTSLKTFLKTFRKIFTKVDLTSK